MDIFVIKIFGKNILTYYNHYIMELCTQRPAKVNTDLDVVFKEIMDEDMEALKEIGGFDMTYIQHLKRKYNEKIFGVGAYVSGEIVGYAWLCQKGCRDRQYIIKHTDFYIFDAFVSEKFRGHNLAPAILWELVEKCAEGQQESKICLAVRKNNHSAIKSYKKLGFEIVKSKRFIRVLKLNIPQKVL